MMNFFSPSLCAHRRHSKQSQPASSSLHNHPLTLAETPVGTLVRIIGFHPGLAAERQAQLQSYGLAPGHTVKVLQHNPVTVLQIEQFELALEGEMAAYVEVAQSLVD